MTALDVHDLIARCIRRDQQAWSELVDRYAGLVYAVARSQRLSEDLCDDVAQSVFIALARSLEQIRDPHALIAWLSTTARREAWQRLRAARREDRLVRAKGDIARQTGPVTQAGDEVDVAEVDQSLLALERAHRVNAALDDLGGRCRDLLRALFAVNDPDYARIAQDLGMPIGSIGPTRRRCLEKLAAILSPTPPSGGTPAGRG